MTPPNGMQPQLIVTIQPAGAKFDPPAPLTLPNVDGHAPGAEVEMYSFDHDQEEFVAIGLGTVSRDGSLIESNIGVGVIKAGWHCGSQPVGQGCMHNCPACQFCTEPECVCEKIKDELLEAINIQVDVTNSGMGKAIIKVMSTLGLTQEVKGKFFVNGKMIKRCCQNAGNTVNDLSASVGASGGVTITDFPIPGYGVNLPYADLGVFVTLSMGGNVSVTSFHYDPCLEEYSGSVSGSLGGGLSFSFKIAAEEGGSNILDVKLLKATGSIASGFKLIDADIKTDVTWALSLSTEITFFDAQIRVTHWSDMGNDVFTDSILQYF
jgi:hypothetical protein